MPTPRPIDKLDARILKELSQSPVRESYASIAQKLRIDEETLRKRIKRLYGQEFETLQLALNPHVIQRKGATIELQLDDEARKPTVISQVKLVDGVVQIIDFHGRELEVVVYYEDEHDLSRKVQLISSICADKKPFYWLVDFPTSSIRLRKTDWQILKAMRKDPRKSLVEIASEIHASVRTVRRRLSLMTKGNVSHLMPVPSFEKSVSFSCSLLIHCPDSKKRNALDKLLLSKVEKIVFHASSQEYSIVAGVFQNFHEADQTARWIRQVDGVDDLKMRIMKDFIFLGDWLDREIEKRLLEPC